MMFVNILFLTHFSVRDVIPSHDTFYYEINYTELSESTNIEECTSDNPDINIKLSQETHIEEGTSDIPEIITELFQDTNNERALQTNLTSIQNCHRSTFANHLLPSYQRN